MRDFPVLSGLNPYRTNRNIGPKHHGSEAEVLLKVANLAFQLGFQNKQIKEAREWAGNNAVARDLLHHARPPERYIMENIHLIAELREPASEPMFTTDLEKQPKKFRCSRPSKINFEVLRLIVSSPITRHVESDSVIGGKALRKGSKVLIIYRQLHLDNSISGPSLETLQPDRFLADKTLKTKPAFRP
ncbi:hypothetical protein BDV11DRAFT_167834 [Aspergillus similis]